MMKNLKKPGSRKVEETRKYEAEKARVVVTWPSVAMYVRASCVPLVVILILCHIARTSVVVTADFWLADWSAAVPHDAAATADDTVCGSVLLRCTRTETRTEQLLRSVFSSYSQR